MAVLLIRLMAWFASHRVNAWDNIEYLRAGNSGERVTAALTGTTVLYTPGS